MCVVCFFLYGFTHNETSANIRRHLACFQGVSTVARFCSVFSGCFYCGGLLECVFSVYFYCGALFFTVFLSQYVLFLCVFLVLSLVLSVFTFGCIFSVCFYVVCFYCGVFRVRTHCGVFSSCLHRSVFFKCFYCGVFLVCVHCGMYSVCFTITQHI